MRYLLLFTLIFNYFANYNSLAQVIVPSWEESIKLVPESYEHEDEAFGSSFHIDGDYALVTGHNGRSVVYLYEKVTDKWHLKAELKLSKSIKNFKTLTSVAIQNDVILVSDVMGNEGIGMVYVFVKPESGWTSMDETMILTPSDGVAGDWFGASISIDEDVVVVGASIADNNKGAVYIYKQSGKDWKSLQELIKIPCPGIPSSLKFGNSVDINNNTLVVGSPGPFGFAFVYEKGLNGWENPILKASLGSTHFLTNYFGLSVQISETEDVIAVGDRNGGDDSKGKVALFVKPEGGWVNMSETSALVPPSGSAKSDFFGAEVSMYGDTVLVSSHAKHTPDGAAFTGGAYIFIKPESGWGTIEFPAFTINPPGGNINRFGSPLLLQENEMMIGANLYNGSDGALFYYTKTNNEWSEPFVPTDTIFQPNLGAPGDKFGKSVYIHKSYAIVGAPVHGPYRGGGALIYELINGIWTKKALLKVADPKFSLLYEFGASVFINDEIAIVGCPNDDGHTLEEGAVYIFEKPTDGWVDTNESIAVKAGDHSMRQHFGSSISVHNNLLLVGATGNSNFTGAAYLYQKPTSGWKDIEQIAKLTATTDNKYSNFGSPVALTEKFAVVGSKGDAEEAHSAGAAYIFEKPASGWANATETAKLTASDALKYDHFGSVLSASDSIVVVGVSRQTKTDLPGKAYVYVKPSSGWVDMVESATLSSSLPNPSNNFGSSLAISSQYIVVGSPGEDVFGEDAGAVYLFDRPTENWEDKTETYKIFASDPLLKDYFGDAVSISGSSILVGAYGVSDLGDFSGSAYVFDQKFESITDDTLVEISIKEDSEVIFLNLQSYLKEVGIIFSVVENSNPTLFSYIGIDTSQLEVRLNNDAFGETDTWVRVRGANNSSFFILLQIKVEPVPDKPVVIPTETIYGYITENSIILKPNEGDGDEILYFYLSDFQNCELFLDDGIIPIAENSFISVEEGIKGIKLKPHGTGISTFKISGSLSAIEEEIGNDFVNVAIPVKKAPLLVKAEDQSITYGSAFAPFTISYSGFVEDENLDSLASRPVVESLATSSSPVGTYLLIPSGGMDNNYEFVYEQGVLNIEKAHAEIIFTSLNFYFDGSPKPVQIVTNPKGLVLDVSYDGGLALPVDPGTYEVFASINDLNYKGEASETLHISMLTSVEENLIGNLMIFPSPVKNELHIHSDLFEGKEVNIELLTISGNFVWGKSFKALNSPQEVFIPETPNGLYFLLIKSEGKALSRKIIISK